MIIFEAMGIEEDIQQLNFKSSKHKAMVNIIYTYGWIMEQIKNFVAHEDITHQQYNILRILRGSHPNPLSTLQIRERMLDKMSDTSRIVDRLVIKGLVQKLVCSADKRLVDITITEKGQEVLQRLDARESSMEKIMQSLSDEEAERLSHMLDQLRQAD